MGSTVRDLGPAGRADRVCGRQRISNPSLDNNTAASAPSPAFHRNATGNGTLTEVYVDTDNNDIVVINTYVFQATADYSDPRVCLSPPPDSTITTSATNSTLDRRISMDRLQEDDYLLITCAQNKDEESALAEVLRRGVLLTETRLPGRRHL